MSANRRRAGASFSNVGDNYRKQMTLDPKNSELVEINSIVKSATVNESAARQSWTSKMLCGGLCSVLKKVNEEAAELVIAACAQTKKDTIMESADLIYHIILLLRPLGISFESLMLILKQQANVKARVCSLGVLQGLAVRFYNRIAAARNEQLLKGLKAESVISTIVYKLYTDLSHLTFLSTRIGISSFVSVSEIKNSIYNILFSTLLILYYKDVEYQCVVDELYRRLDLKKKAKMNIAK
ncbi:MAG: phosphoribosyl-ATP diphosphatase [Candidatus Hodgkinia cicadicola]